MGGKGSGKTDGRLPTKKELLKQERQALVTKEDLIAYLEKHKATELPFNEEVWELAVEKTKDKEQVFMEMYVKDFDGVVRSRKVPNGACNPTSKYFALMSLQQYQKQGKNEKREIEKFSVMFEDEEKAETLTSWIKIFFAEYGNAEKKFLTERLSDYYDNYELNEGADKMLVIKAVADELEIMNLTKQRAKGKDVEGRISKVQSGYLDLLDSLKALKKQRGKMEEGKNKLTQMLDEFEKAGEFVGKKAIYEKDSIDDMLDTFTKNMMVVLRDG